MYFGLNVVPCGKLNMTSYMEVMQFTSPQDIATDEDKEFCIRLPISETIEVTTIQQFIRKLSSVL